MICDIANDFDLSAEFFSADAGQCCARCWQKRLRGAAKAWLQDYDDLFDEACFLVAGVEGETIEWIDDAFDG